MYLSIIIFSLLASIISPLSRNTSLQELFNSVTFIIRYVNHSWPTPQLYSEILQSLLSSSSSHGIINGKILNTMNLEDLIYLGVFIYIICITILLINIYLDPINESKPGHITEPINKPDQKKPNGGIINLFCCRLNGLNHVRPRIYSGRYKNWDSTKYGSFFYDANDPSGSSLVGLPCAGNVTRIVVIVNGVHHVGLFFSIKPSYMNTTRLMVKYSWLMHKDVSHTTVLSGGQEVNIYPTGLPSQRAAWIANSNPTITWPGPASREASINNIID